MAPLIIFSAILLLIFFPLINYVIHLREIRDQLDDVLYGKNNKTKTELVLLNRLFIPWLIIAGLLIFVSFFTPYLFTWGISDPKDAGPIGDSIGGLMNPFIAIAGVIVTGLAFYVQYQANQIQRLSLDEQQASAKEEKKQINLQQFESNFFELVKLHRENVSELNYTKFDGVDKAKAEHRKVFRLIFKEFIECFREVKGFSNSNDPNDYLLPEYKLELAEIVSNNNSKIDIVELAIIDIAYSILFYGIGEEGEAILREKFKKRYNHNYFYPLLEYIKLKPKQEDKDRWEIWLKLREFKTKELREIIQEFYEYKRVTKRPTTRTSLSAKTLFLDYDKKFYKYYGGHQHRLGHYFRHLFQCYKFLNYHKNLSEDEKYLYGKTLRAQLSTYEQALFFVNSLSTLGMKWEFTPEIELMPEKENLDYIKLITRYNLIKNLPGYHLAGLKYKIYYPNIKYEIDE